MKDGRGPAEEDEELERPFKSFLNTVPLAAAVRVINNRWRERTAERISQYSSREHERKEEIVHSQQNTRRKPSGKSSFRPPALCLLLSPGTASSSTR